MNWSTQDLDVAGVTLHITRAGSGRPLLLLHGLTDNGPCWGRTADALAQEYDVLSLDLRAHGHSDAPDSGYGPADFAADAAGVLRALALPPTVVMGHSLGARTALTLAARHPELVSQAILVDPPLRDHSATAQEAEQLREQWSARLHILQALSPAERVAHCHEESPLWSEEECVVWAESKTQVREAIWGTGGLVLDTDWRAELGAVSCAALLVRGDAELGSIVTQDLSAAAMTLLAKGSELMIEGAGHSIHRDQNASFLAGLRAWLQQNI